MPSGKYFILWLLLHFYSPVAVNLKRNQNQWIISRLQVHALMDKMTLDDKLNLMDGDIPFWSGFNEMAKGYNVKPYPAGVMPEIGIYGIRFIDGPRGIVMKGSTTFPVTMARGATWDIALEEKVGEAIGKELRAQGGNFFGGACINLLRHPCMGQSPGDLWRRSCRPW